MPEYTEIFSKEACKSASILIVDDEASNVLLLEKMLGANGYTNIVSTQNPTEVLALYEEYKSDLVLLDLNMPEIDGFGVMKAFHDRVEGDFPPIIVLTAQHMQDYRQRALDMGARDYVTKPFNVKELLSRVHNTLEVKLAHNFMLKQNEILEHKVQERTKEIHDTQLQVIRCLGLASEYKDEETGLHIIRMSQMAVIIAQQTNMSKEMCDLLLHAAPMHDVGKIGIPDHILLKPGKFEAEEWEIMKTHAQIGANILAEESSNLMKMAYDIALTHHEKWNGSGYPNGLSGEDIPIVGRITALADVFDALTSIRPYKTAWSIEKAVELIKSESGKHFDPELVEIFISQLPAIEAIKVKYEERG